MQMLALWSRETGGTSGMEFREMGNVLFNDALNIFTVIWRRTYGKGPLR